MYTVWTACIHPVPGLITSTGVPHLLLYLSSLHTHTHCEVLFCPGWHSEHSSCILWSSCVWLWTVYFCWFSAACPCDIAPGNSDWVAACPDPCPVLFTSLPCLWHSWHCCLITACLTLSKFIKLRLQMDPHASDPSLHWDCLVHDGHMQCSLKSCPKWGIVEYLKLQKHKITRCYDLFAFRHIC